MARKNKTKRALKSKPAPITPTRVISRLIDDFISEINSLRLSSKEASVALETLATDRATSLQNFLARFTNHIVKNGNEVTIKLRLDQVQDLLRELKAFEVATRTVPFFYEGQFLVLVSRWDCNCSPGWFGSGELAGGQVQSNQG
jgi:ethanolamine utilization microcompartment shell protein EutS